MVYLPARELNLRPNMGLMWLSWWMAFIGLLVAALPLLANEATVLYTFYPPLKATGPSIWGRASSSSPAGEHLPGPGPLAALEGRKPRQGDPPGHLPGRGLLAHVVHRLHRARARGRPLPPALVLRAHPGGGPPGGPHPLLVDGPPHRLLLAHAAYAIIYTVLPKQAGGKLVSDPMARLAFLLFLLLSTPVGFHHQFADPGIDPTWKMIHSILTMFVAVPSLMTAFTVAASLELAGRMREVRAFSAGSRPFPGTTPPSWPRSWASSASSPGAQGAW